jgi:hypothetical protein
MYDLKEGSMKSVWSLTKFEYIVSLITVLTIVAIGCSGAEKKVTGDAGGQAGTSGTVSAGGTGGTSDASAIVTGGTGGFGGSDAGNKEDADVGGNDAHINNADTGASGNDASVSNSDSGSTIKAKTYTDNGDGTVTDQTTGLMWMSCPAGQSGSDCSTGSITPYSWQKAMDYCDNMTWAGYSDWRLPNVSELISSVDYTKYKPAIDSTAFPDTSTDYFWSSLSWGNFTSYAWHVSFFGSVAGEDKAGGDMVRCVRGGPLVIGSFESSVISGERVVQDKVSGLMWQGCASGQSGELCDQGTAIYITWQGAVDYCDSLTWAGYGDWRLPNVNELTSIVDYTKSEPAIDSTAFPATPPGFFWSSSSYESSTSNVWYVVFSSGSVGDFDKADEDNVRCVRGGP